MTTTDKGPGLWTAAPVHGGFLVDAERINQRILTAFVALAEADFSRRTHFFVGRFENLYLDRDRIPELRIILEPGGVLGTRDPEPGRPLFALRILVQRPEAWAIHLRAHP